MVVIVKCSYHVDSIAELLLETFAQEHKLLSDVNKAGLVESMSANTIVNKQLTGNLCLPVVSHNASLILNDTGDHNASLVEVPISRVTCMQNDELSSISTPNHHHEVVCI